ncbi:hypothetical protein Tco_1549130 [Tanacetum coccineum]
MASESSSQQLPKTLTPPSYVHFELEDGHVAFNSVALLEFKYPEYKDMLQFISHCCISKALVIKPSVSFDRNIFASVTGLEYSKNYVSLPDHETVKDAIATLGLLDEKETEKSSRDLAHSSPLRLRFFSPTWKVLMTYLVKCMGGNQGSHDQLNINQQMIAYALCWGLIINITGILYDDLISKLTAGGKKGREKNICYTRYLSLVIEHLLGEAYVNNDLFPTKSYQITGATFKQSLLSEVPLTSYMHKIAKLFEEPLNQPSDEVNIEATGAMSLFGTSVHPLSEPKAKSNKKRRKKKTPSSSEPNVSKVVNQTPISQASGSQHAEEIEVIADTTQSLEASKSAEDQENQPQTADAEKLMHVQENIAKEAEHNVAEHNDEELVHSDLHSTGDTTLESLNETAAFNEESDMEEDSGLASIPDDEPSDALGHLQAEITSLSTKVDQLESSIINKVSKIQSSVPTFITNYLKEQLPELLSEALKTTLPTIVKDIPSLFIKPLNKELNAFNKLEAHRFIHLEKELSKVIQTQIGKKVKSKVRTRMSKIADMLSLLKSVEVLKQTNAEREKYKDATDDEPPKKRLKVLIRTPTPLRSIFPEPPRVSSPPRDETLPRDERKGKEIATEEEPLKKLLPLLEQGGSDPKMITLQQFSTAGKKMTLEEAEAQLNHLKRLADLKAAEEKSLKSLEKIMNSFNIKAQPAKMAEYEAKRAKMLAEYNHYITFRADQRRITKINYIIEKVTKEATMRIERDNQPLSLTVMEKFGLKQLGFSEWIKIQALESKGKSKATDTLLKSLKAKFEWIQTQAGKLGLPPPPELTEVGLSAVEKKRKRTSETIKEVFVKENIRVDGMDKNLIPPPGVVAIKGKVITEPESCIFFYNGNFDYVFQRENEFHLATTAQLIRQLRNIQRTTPEVEDMFKRLQLTIEARNDIEQAKKIVRENLDDDAIPTEFKASEGSEDQLSAKHQLVIKGLANGKASASNLRDIQVKDIVKEIEDYLKTYSSA